MSTTISQSLLPEFDMEIAGTRRTLERVPEGKGDFRPHEKSMTLGRLAAHLGEIPMWAAVTLGQDEFDTAGRAGGATMSSRQALLDEFDANVARARALLVECTDAEMTRPWSLKHGERVIMSMPKVAVFRGFVLNHMIDHRAQLGVYLRMNDIPVPSIYGPSADEAGR